MISLIWRRVIELWDEIQNVRYVFVDFFLFDEFHGNLRHFLFTCYNSISKFGNHSIWKIQSTAKKWQKRKFISNRFFSKQSKQFCRFFFFLFVYFWWDNIDENIIFFIISIIFISLHCRKHSLTHFSLISIEKPVKSVEWVIQKRFLPLLAMGSI